MEPPTRSTNELRPDAGLRAPMMQLAPHDSQVVDGNEFRERAHSAGTGSLVCSQLSDANRLASLYERPAATSRAPGLIASTIGLNYEGASTRACAERAQMAAPARSDRPGTASEPAHLEGSSSRKQPTLESRAIELLAKDCFTCTLVGDRQSGKRTIVKCFIKLLNEFKLAAEEYRREKMLAKLMDCSERLQTLKVASENQLQLEREKEKEQQQHRHHHRHDALARKGSPRVRVNSWIAEGKSVANKLLNLPSSIGATKRRLNSMVVNYGDRLETPELYHNDRQRRHTAAIDRFEQFEAQANESPEESATANSSRAHTHLKLNKPAYGSGSISDNSGSYENSICSSGDSSESDKLVAMRQAPCNKSDFNINYSFDDAHVDVSSRALESPVIAQLAVPDIVPTRPRSSSERLIRADSRSVSPNNYHNRADGGADVGLPTEPEAKRTRQGLRIGFKELNKRRVKVRFSTRRQLSDKYLVEELDDKTSVEVQFPDCFIVVYAINDR